MRSPTRWLAILATCGTIGGGTVALTHTAPDQASTLDASTQIPITTPTTAQESGSLTAANLNVQLLLSEANQLQTAITSARSTLARSLNSTSAAVAASTTTPDPPTTGSSSATFQAQSQQLSADEASVAAQRQQLANEAAQLGTESQQLSAEQTQLQQEAAALAAAQAQQPAPTTTTTSGKGTKNGSKGD